MFTITSVHSLLEYLSRKDIGFSFYRGHSKTDYLIKPSIGRNDEKFTEWLFEIEHDEKLSEMQTKSVGLQQYEWWALSELKARKIPYHDKDLNYFDLMILAQHHGLRTRLLDVTTNPLVGLYFACSNDNTDGCLVAFNKEWSKIKIMKTGINDIATNLIGEDIRGFLMFMRTLDKYTFVRPSHLSPRIIAQDGNFIMFKQPLKEIQEDENVSKLLIPKEHKGKIREELKKLGFVQSKLFPELNSVAAEIDSQLF